MEDANEGQRKFWRDDVGGIWVGEADRLERLHGPFTDIILDAAGLREGERVLDLGCGTGAVTRRAAVMVGPAGRVTGLDISSTMLDGARSIPLPGDAAPVDWLEADAQTHPFEPVAYDVILSRMGVMFFADPEAALANLLSAAAPGARFAAICWRTGADNPWFGLASAAVEDVLGPQEPSDPLAPGPMAFADGARVTGLLGAAGWREAAVARVPVILRTGGTIENTVDLMTCIGPASRALRLAGAGEIQETELRARVAERLEPYREGSGVAIPVAMNLFSARAPG
ncbi:methyltransferase domain-containing protein [Rhodobacterales bacterium HKCCE2091]|nr:methyltransferase domain-containing protein [Rhodobacterales bacterium HKCCE2091]